MISGKLGMRDCRYVQYQHVCVCKACLSINMCINAHVHIENLRVHVLDLPSLPQHPVSGHNLLCGYP